MSASILLAALLFPLQTGKAQVSGWETVVSEDGQFSVEMPSKPNFRSNSSRGESGGPSRVLARGSRTPAGSYYVQKLEYRTTIVAGQEDTQLDSLRDELARHYGGNPTGEKKITLDGGSPGREFTLRGKPKGETGVVTVRVREYVVGQVLYALLVTSPANGELPDNTDRFLGSLKIIASGQAKAAPSPPAVLRRRTPTASKGAAAERERTLEGWGVAMDPDGDCKIHPEGNTLVIDVPNTPHALLANFRSKPNAPRVLREVEGNFEVQVKVDGTFTPNGNDSRPMFAPTIGAGLVLIRDENNYITLERQAILRNGKPVTSVKIAERGENTGRGMQNPQLGKGPTYLRLARNGSKILPSASNDGKTWESLRPVEVQWPRQLKLGLTAESSSTDPFSVTFGEYTVKKYFGTEKEQANQSRDVDLFLPMSRGPSLSLLRLTPSHPIALAPSID